MTTYPDAESWLSAFRHAPDDCLDRLLSHWDSISPFQRAEANQALQSALADHGRAGDEDLVDGALAGWLDRRLAEGPEVVAAEGWDAYVDTVIEGLALMARHPLPRAGRRLRDRWPDVKPWAEMLSKPGPGDVLAHAYGALAHNQDDDDRFIREWLKLCARMARDGDDGLLDTALMGLAWASRPAEEAAPGRATLEGLSLWARGLADTPECRERFLYRWRVLAGRFPHTPASWQPLVEEFVDSHAGAPFTAWWRDELGMVGGGSAGPVRAPLPADTDRVLVDLAKFPRDGDLDAVVGPFRRWHERYVATSGSADDLPRAFNMLGNALLRRGGERALRLAERLAAIALDHDRSDGHSWVLRGRALAALGQGEMAETVLWEAVAELPDNAYCRTALAEMLAGSGREEEAEALHRDTMRRFPDNPACRTALADVLAGSGWEEEAEALYRQTAKTFPEQGHCRLALGLLLIRLDRLPEVPPLLADLKAMRDTGAQTLDRHYREALAGKPVVCRMDRAAPPAPAKATVPDVGGEIRAMFLLSPALDDPALLLMTQERRAELRAWARTLVYRELERRPSDVALRLMAYRHGIVTQWPLSSADARIISGRDYPLRVETALVHNDGEAMGWVWEDFPQHRTLTAVAWMLVDDMAEIPARHLVDWLARQSDAGEPLHFLWRELRSLLKPFALRGIDEFVDDWARVMAGADDVAAIRNLLDIVIVSQILSRRPLMVAA